MSQRSTGDVLLKVENMHTFYGTIEALKGISIDVHEGEIVTLIGANGAGKSTTLRSINGLNQPREGSITFRGQNITRRPPHEIVGLGISQSPEGRRLFPRMSVIENLEMGAFQRTDRKQIREGDKVVMWFASGNRDESVFEDPYRFDVTRNPEHQAFGAGGRHFCLGTALARLELRILIEETLKRYPEIALDGRPAHAATQFVNQLKSLPVRLNA